MQTPQKETTTTPARRTPFYRSKVWKKEAPFITLAFASVIVFFFAIFWFTLPDVTQVTKYAPAGAIEIYDGKNNLVSTLEGNEEKEFVPISSIPLVMQQAMMAAEDHTFYEHKGIDPRGIGRAFIANLAAGHVVEGGSTITQQLAKVRFFDSGDRSLLRKLREAATATEIEKHFTKKQIMEMYLNEVYFGRNSYGIEMAAMRFFGKPSRKLTLPESAFLAGLVRQPSFLSNPDHFKEATERQHEVIDAMVQLHFISPKQAKQAEATKLNFVRLTTPTRKFPYYTAAVLDILHQTLSDEQIEQGGLRVFTNMDPAAQSIAERVIASAHKGAPPGMNEAALASVRVSDGAVIAIVGGMGDYWEHQWNSATHPHTLGSAFKPFVYLTGFMQGIFDPNSAIDDDPVVIHQKGAPDYAPRNFDNDFLGPIPVWEALALSRNVCAIRAAAAEGVGNVIHTAQLAGITSPLDPHISIALGASAVTPIEIAGAYSTFARGGYQMTPLLVRSIEGRSGVIRSFHNEPKKVFDSKPLQMLISCMEMVVQRGTGVNAQLPGRPVAGKTGTTDQGRDLWFVGFTPDVATAVWGGNNEHKPLAGNVTGGMVMAGIWKRYYTAYYQAHPTKPGTFFAKDKENPLENLLHFGKWEGQDNAAQPGQTPNDQSADKNQPAPDDIDEENRAQPSRQTAQQQERERRYQTDQLRQQQLDEQRAQQDEDRSQQYDRQDRDQQQAIDRQDRAQQQQQPIDRPDRAWRQPIDRPDRAQQQPQDQPDRSAPSGPSQSGDDSRGPSDQSSSPD